VQRIRKWGDSKLRNDLAPGGKEHRLATKSREFDSPWVMLFVCMGHIIMIIMVISPVYSKDLFKLTVVIKSAAE
jgi:hypothetical protein